MRNSGILLLHKPLGVRSAACVSLVKWFGKGQYKVGHGGTLDSTAEGLLVVLLGSATRMSQFIMNFPKKYIVTLQFGTSTSTDDASGEIVQKTPLPSPKILEKRVDALLPSFLGARMQRPPNISAVHIGGKRAHHITRAGETPNIPEKKVSFYNVSRTSSATPEGTISFSISCSKGTYIRSFARDMGEKLGVAAHSSALCRVALGKWRLSHALPLEKLELWKEEPVENRRKRLWEVCCSPLEVASHYNLFKPLSEKISKDLQNGNPVSFEDLSRQSWGLLPWQEGLAVALEQDIVFGKVESSKKHRALFIPSKRISLEGKVS